MNTLVIGDLHGDHAGLLALLRESGAVDSNDQRRDGWRIIQLGDCIHGGMPRHPERPGVDDARCLTLALNYCHKILIGNHELPHVWPDAGFPTFGGQRAIPEKMRAKLLAAYDTGQLVAATQVDEWLLTHAGLHPVVNRFPGWEASKVARAIRYAFTMRLDRNRAIDHLDNLIDGVSLMRGGRNAFGGIFWCDWRELTAVGVTSPIPQIVGHTPQGTAPRQHGNLWGCDVGAALSGLVCGLVRRDGEDWAPLVVESAAGAEAA